MDEAQNVKAEERQGLKRIGMLTNLRNRLILYVGLVGFWRNIAIVIIVIALIFTVIIRNDKSIVVTNENDESSIVTNGDNIQVLLPDEKNGAYIFVGTDESDDDKKYDSGNRIQNPSFENGLWQEKVGDCHNHDDNPILSMKQSDNASDGNKSLELQAKRHIACTSQKNIDVEGGGIFLLKFDYQSDNAKNAGYYIAFDNKDKTNISEKLPIENTNWNTFEKQIEIPRDATKANLFVYSYSEEGSKENEDEDNSQNIIIRYDNFYLVGLPDVRDKYYYMDEFDFEIKNPTEIIVDGDNGKKAISVKGATTSFFLVSNVTYNNGWKLHLSDNSEDVSNEYHFESKGYKNGWYIDVDELCEGNDSDSCVKNENGSYDMKLIMEYSEINNFKSDCCFWNKLIIISVFIIYIIWDIFDRRKRKKTALRKRKRDFMRNSSR